MKLTLSEHDPKYGSTPDRVIEEGSSEQVRWKFVEELFNTASLKYIEGMVEWFDEPQAEGEISRELHKVNGNGYDSWVLIF